MPHELTTNLKKIVVLKYRLLFFYATTMNYFSIRLGRATKSGFYTTTSSVVGPWSSEVLPRAKLIPKKGHDHCSVVGYRSDPLQLSESQQNHYNWEVCSANRWEELKTATPAFDTGRQNRPNSFPGQRLTTCHITITSKVKQLSYKAPPHPPHSPDFSPTFYHFFEHLNDCFAGKMLPQPAGGENAFQEFVESWATDF